MYTRKEIDSMILDHGSDPLGLLRKLGGYYECPKNGDSKRLGPLVGYAGKYSAPDDEHKKQYVGDIYANFSVAEQYPAVMEHFANKLTIQLSSLHLNVDLVCGPVMGGVSIGMMLALTSGQRFAYAEKQVTQLATAALREQSTLALLRHTVFPGENVIICEDVLNNFSTTSETIKIIEAADAKVVGIAGLLNRSLTIEDYYDHGGSKIPIIALVRKKIFEWKQDDPEVLADMERGNVIFKPKNDWGKLTEAMRKQIVA